MFVIDTNASGLGLGAVLMQDDCPVAFHSQKLSPTARTRSVYIYEIELIAIVFIIERWRLCILGKHFVVRTDTESLFSLGVVGNQSRVSEWVLKLLPYNFTIQYKPGSTILRQIPNRESQENSTRIYPCSQPQGA